MPYQQRTCTLKMILRHDSLAVPHKPKMYCSEPVSAFGQFHFFVLYKRRYARDFNTKNQKRSTTHKYSLYSWTFQALQLCDHRTHNTLPSGSQPPTISLCVFNIHVQYNVSRKADTYRHIDCLFEHTIQSLTKTSNRNQ